MNCKVFVAMLLFGVTALLLSASWLFASGGMVEFCPQTLEVRRYSETLLWGTDRMLYRSLPQKHSYPLVDYLIEQGHWTPIPGEQLWLVTSRWNHQWRDGQSSFHREASRGRAETWILWSQEHPEAAMTMWPLVLQLLRSKDSGLDAAGYFLLCARAASSPDEVQSMFDDVMNELDYSPRRGDSPRSSEC